MKTMKLFFSVGIISVFCFATKNSMSMGFSYTQTSSCPPFNIDFTVFSQPGGATSYTWDFGDNSGIITTADTNIIHDYTGGGGNYNQVTVKAYDVGNNLLDQVTQDVNINGPGFNSFVNKACPGDIIRFCARNNSGEGDVLQWDFGDGTVVQVEGGSECYEHTFSSTDTFNVSASIYDAACGNITVFRKIIIGSAVTPQLNNGTGWQTNPICPGDAEFFYLNNVAGIFSWNFGDGALLTTTSTNDIKHTYESVGDYSASVQVTNGCGISASATDTIKVQSNVPINLSNFGMPNGEPNPSCPNDLIAFDCWNCDRFSRVIWNFGDGAVDSLNNRAFHAYSTTGTKFPILTLYNGCGKDTTILLTAVSIQTGLTVDTSQLKYIVVPDSACAGDPVTFLIDNSYSKYTWDYNDGSKDTVPLGTGGDIVYFSHVYSALNTYNTVFTVTNGCGNSASKTAPVFVGINVPVKPANFGDGPAGFGVVDGDDDNLPRCKPVTLFAFSGTSYVWDFGDGTILTTTYGLVTHVFDSVKTYTVTLTTTNSCGNSATFAENFSVSGPCLYPCPFSVNATTTAATCGNADGSATVSVSGGVVPYTYLWQNGSATATATGLAAGSYYGQVTDSLGCISYGLANVSNSGITVTPSSQNITCKGSANGSITLTVTGGTAPFTYLWNNGATTNSLSNLPAGSYEYTVTDSQLPQQCVATGTVTLTEPDAISIFMLTNTAGCSIADGSATTTVIGGVTPYTYAWSNGDTTSSINGVLAGNYTLSVTDFNGCVKSKIATVNNTGGPGVTVSASSNPTCSDSSSGSISISVSGGLLPYTYLWSNDSVTVNLSNLTAGTYSVVVTDGSNCIGAASATLITEPPVNPGICIITVDSATGKNLIVFSKDPGAVSYNIYKESSLADSYFKLGSVSTGISTFTDSLADPRIRSWRYKLSSVDSCGNESPVSSLHKTMHLTSNLGINNEVNLIWNDYDGFGFGSYLVYRWDSSLTYTLLETLPSNLHSYSDFNHPAGALSYIVEAQKAVACTPGKVKSYSSSKSNTSTAIAPVAVGVEKVNFDAVMRIFPNPNRGEFTLEVTDEILKQNPEVSVYNLLGEKVFRLHGSFLQATNKLDLEKLLPGVYFIRLSSSKRTDYAKIVIW